MFFFWLSLFCKYSDEQSFETILLFFLQLLNCYIFIVFPLLYEICCFCVYNFISLFYIHLRNKTIVKRMSRNMQTWDAATKTSDHCYKSRVLPNTIWTMICYCMGSSINYVRVYGGRGVLRLLKHPHFFMYEQKILQWG